MFQSLNPETTGPPKGTNFGEFLVDFGLSMASCNTD